MNEEDFQELAGYLRRELREVGLGAIADERDYVEDFGDGPVLPSAQIEIVEMLAALERFTKLRDKATYEQAMAKIRASVDGVADVRPTVLRTRTEGGEYRRSANFDDLPDLRGLREDIFHLMSDLKQSRDDPQG